MTKEEIIKLAEARADAELHMNVLAQQNMPSDAAERVRASAECRLAYDAYIRAYSDYERAIGNLTTEQLRELAR